MLLSFGTDLSVYSYNHREAWIAKPSCSNVKGIRCKMHSQSETYSDDDVSIVQYPNKSLVMPKLITDQHQSLPVNPDIPYRDISENNA